MWSRISARRYLAAIAVSALSVVGLGGVASAEQATRRIRVAEDNAPRPADRVFFSYDYFTQITIEGGVSSGETSGGIGNLRDPVKFERRFFGVDAAIGMRAPFQSPVTGAEAAIVTGFKFRFYFGDEKDDQALVNYSRDRMFMPYIGIPLAFPKPGQPPGGTQFVLTPFVGPIFEQGELSIFNNQGKASVTRYGLGVGLNFDVVFPSTSGFRPFVGAGGQLSFMQSVKEDIDGFDTHLDRDVQARAVVRGGVIFSP